MKIANNWDFVQVYFPEYDSSDAIAENDDLHKICNGEINGYAQEMYNEKIEDLKIFWGGTVEQEDLDKIERNTKIEIKKN